MTMRGFVILLKFILWYDSSVSKDRKVYSFLMPFMAGNCRTIYGSRTCSDCRTLTGIEDTRRLTQIAPLVVLNWLMSACMSVAISPDLFMPEPMNAVMALANPVVPPWTASSFRRPSCSYRLPS